MTADVLLFVWSSFLLWLSNIFVVPFRNFEILWILVPVYLGMILSEIFQEKHGTSMGNAISNSVIVFWGGIDFLRITVNSALRDGFVLFDAVKLIIALAIIAYGVIILVAGLMAKTAIKRYARIRVVSYCIIIFAPIYYSAGTLDWSYMFGAVVFFPIFYGVMELFDIFLPDPVAFKLDNEAASGGTDHSTSNSSSSRVNDQTVQQSSPDRRQGFIAPGLHTQQPTSAYNPTGTYVPPGNQYRASYSSQSAQQYPVRAPSQYPASQYPVPQYPTPSSSQEPSPSPPSGSSSASQQSPSYYPSPPSSKETIENRRRNPPDDPSFY